MTTASILFWNIQKRPIPTRISKIVNHFEVDILVLAECKIEQAIIESKLVSVSGKTYKELGLNKGGKLRFFSQFRESRIQDHFDSLMGDLSIKRIVLRNGVEILLGGVHLPSPLGMASETAAQYSVKLSSDIAKAEDRAGHSRTILIGDFNMNPFDQGIMGTLGLAAVMSRQQLHERSFRKIACRPFYNPMWGLFGDRTSGPPGTYKFAASGVANVWHLLDQVLLRAQLTNAIQDLRIVDTDGATSLLTPNGYPDTKRGSDHLPVLIKLDSERIDDDG